MLTDDHLVKHEIRSDGIGGVQRIYRFANGYGLSLIDDPMLHSYSFAWEAAVLKGVTNEGKFKGVYYGSPLTDSVVAFDTEEDANAFIHRAAEHFGSAV